MFRLQPYVLPLNSSREYYTSIGVFLILLTFKMIVTARVRVRVVREILVEISEFIQKH